MTWHKIENGTTFQICDFSEEWESSIWDNTTKKFLKAQPGQIATLQGIDGNIYPLDSLRSMRNEEIIHLFPNHRRSWNIIKNIKTNGIIGQARFRVTLDRALKDKISTIQQMNQNPLDYYYQVHKTGTGLQTRYSIELVYPTQQQQPVYPQPTFTTAPQHYTPPPVYTQNQQLQGTNSGMTGKTEFSYTPVSSALNLPATPPTPQAQPQPLELSDRERELVNKLKSLGFNPTAEQFLEMCLTNGIVDKPRTDTIYQQHFTR